MFRIITAPIEDYLYNLNKREEAKKKQKEPSTSFEEELQKAEKELSNGTEKRTNDF